MPKTMDRYRVKPGAKVKLSKINPAEIALFKNGKGAKKEGREAVAALNKRLEALQELMFAEHKHKLLVVLQAMDTGGKDGVVRSVFDGVNPAGVRVQAFGVPSKIEADHDHLWRLHQVVPARGEITIFNRSHYEEMLVVRVENLKPGVDWRQTASQIREWEQLLTQTGTTVLKFFLHISKDEQKTRLQERLDDPTKRWKFKLGDLATRAKWDDYTQAFEDVLESTSTGSAPWYVIPADKNWYRDWVISNILVETLEGLKMKYPPTTEDLKGVKIV